MRFLWAVAWICAVAVPSAAAAQQWEEYDYENLAFRGIGVDVGYVLASRTDPALALTARADLGLLGPNVRVAPSMTFWSTQLREREVRGLANQLAGVCERNGTSCSGLDLGDVRISDLSLNLDAHYLWTTPLGIEPYAGVGGAIHLLNGQGDFIDDTFVEDLLDAISPGVNLVGGLELPLGRSLRLVLEGRGALAGDARYLGVSFGGSWTLPSPPPSARPTPTDEERP